jgi:hypothetical protein
MRTAFVISMILLSAIVTPAGAQFIISGTVTTGASVPVNGCNILLYDDTGGAIGIPPTVTNSLGFYSIASIPPGTYGVGFEPKTSDKLMATLTSPILVSGNTTVNASLLAGFFLTGTVFDSVGGGIPNIDLNVYNQATGVKYITPGDNTDILGAYKIVVPAGTLRVRFRAVDGRKLVPVEIENVIVSADTNLNVTMKLGFYVSGTVNNHLNQPVVNVNMDIVDTVSGLTLFTPGDNTDANGFYQVLVPKGTFHVEAKPLPITGLCAKRMSSVPVSNDVTVDVSLVPGSYLSGIVRDIRSAAVVGGDLDVYDATSGLKLITPSDNTDATGNYQVVVPNGNYKVVFSAAVGVPLATKVINGVAVSGNTILNAVLPDGFFLSGVVRNTALVPVSGVDIDAFIVATGANVPLVGDRSASNGSYQVVLAPGIYQIDFEPAKTRRLAAFRLSSVNLTQNTTLNIVVDTGMVISGIVLDNISRPIVGMDIDANTSPSNVEFPTTGDRTVAGGAYDIIVKVGTYNLVYGPEILIGLTDSVIKSGVSISKDTIINVTFGTAPNFPPLLSGIGTRNVNAGSLLTISVSATDPDSTPLTLTTSLLPGTATFTDHHNGTGTCSWSTVLADAGTYFVTFRASDGQLIDTEKVTINVINQSVCCKTLTGNVDCDTVDGVDISDLSALIDNLYITLTPLCCPKEANVDGDVTGGVDISDLSALIDYLYISFTLPAACL